MKNADEQETGADIDKMDAEGAVAFFHSNAASGLAKNEVGERQKRYGHNDIPEKKTSPLARFLKKLWGLTAWMLEAIIIISWFLGKLTDVYIVGGLLVFNAIIGFVQEQNAANAVEALKRRLHVNARVLRDAEWSVVPSEELVPGDILRVRIGDFVPADVKILGGNVGVDESALTGESTGVEKKDNESLYSGSVVTRGEANGIVIATGANTFFGKTAQLVQTASPKLHIERVIADVVKTLLVIVATLLVVTFGVSIIQGHDPLATLPLMLVLLLGAIPVALPAMFTVSMALGSMELVRKGVLVTRLSAPDDAASMDILCVDKTGTLTMNKLSVVSVTPFGKHAENDVLEYGALASQEANNDAIDNAFIDAARRPNLVENSTVLKRFIPFDPKTRRTEGIYEKNGATIHAVKGSVRAIEDMCKLGSEERKRIEQLVEGHASRGYRVLAVAMLKGETPDFMGLVALQDTPRPDSKRMIDELRALGISVKMLTGDAVLVGREIASAVGIGKNIRRASELGGALKENPSEAARLAESSDGFAEVYPEDKYLIVKSLQSRGHIVGMTGDGVNDAPSLRQAEVGIAMSNATDVAKGAASIVLTEEGLKEVVEPIRVGRMMFQRINTWVLNKISRTVLKTCFVVIAFFLTGGYVISSSAMLLVIFMTDFVKISLSTDNVRWSKKPDRWDIPAVTKVALILGLIMVLEALGFFFYGYSQWGLSSDSGALSTFSFEILLFFALFSIFVVREKGHFWDSSPSTIMLAALILDALLGVIFSTFGAFDLTPLPLPITLAVLVFSFAFSLLLNDLIKYAFLRKMIQ